MREEGLEFEIMQNSVHEEQKKRERLRSLQGMILKGGPQGENAKKSFTERIWLAGLRFDY